MSAPNGHAPETAAPLPSDVEPPPLANAPSSRSMGFSPEQLTEILAQLAVPFDPGLIKWRVVATNQKGTRGRVYPYADWRAYADRLNQLLTPCGWSREFSMHTSANFQHEQSRKIRAKVFVTCKLTLNGINSHSSTGEDWAEDPNAGTRAESQASRRAASAFGLGLYFYNYAGVWVDLDREGQPKKPPTLPAWATPEGWRNGLRPLQPTNSPEKAATPRISPAAQRLMRLPRRELLRRIEALAEPLGKGIYHGLLKTLAQKYRPRDIGSSRVLCTVLLQMEGAKRGLDRLDAALDVTGPEAIGPILDSLCLQSLDKVDNLETLRLVVAAMETQAGTAPRPN